MVHGCNSSGSMSVARVPPRVVGILLHNRLTGQPGRLGQGVRTHVSNTCLKSLTTC